MQTGAVQVVVRVEGALAVPWKVGSEDRLRTGEPASAVLMEVEVGPAVHIQRRTIRAVKPWG